jgi:hypothetical protein
MTYGDDRTAGAMSDDERQEYIRRSGEAMTAGQGGAAEMPEADSEECPDCAWNRRYPHVASSFAWSFCMRCRNTGRIERALSAGDGTTEDDRNDG